MTDEVTPMVQQNNDGSVSVTLHLPPTPEWATRIDAAFQRLASLDSPGAHNRWHFVSLSVPSYSYGYICVLEKKGVTHSMSGSAGLECAQAGWGVTEVEAIDKAIELAKLWDSVPHVDPLADSPE